MATKSEIALEWEAFSNSKRGATGIPISLEEQCNSMPSIFAMYQDALSAGFESNQAMQIVCAIIVTKGI